MSIVLALFISLLDMTLGYMFADSYVVSPKDTTLKKEGSTDDKVPILWQKELIIRTIEATQPDGAIIEIEQIMGGVNNPRWDFLRKGEYTVVWDKETKYFCWARQGADGNLESTGYPIHLYDADNLGLEKNIRMSKEQAENEVRHLQKKNKFGINTSDTLNVVSTCPTEGAIKPIICYIKPGVLDVPFPFENQFSKLVDYYQAVSYGELTLTPLYITIPYPDSLAFNGIKPKDDSTNPLGYESINEK